MLPATGGLTGYFLPAIVRSTISPRDGSHNAPYF
nr:MAG TPA: hypothetical protein [Caudoviricetes sp.]